MQRLVLLIVFILNCAAASAAVCHVEDESGLLGFKSGVRAEPSGLLASWKKGTDCCTWRGVTCLSGERVTALSIYAGTNVSLSGTISSSLSKLRYLDGIYLVGHKNLTGAFPSSLFSLPRLLFVYIENNGLSGPLPQDVGKLIQLQALSLKDNQFSGRLPSSIGDLINLTQLVLAGNRLTGTIPSSIQRLKNLTLLNLDRNQLSGTVPDFFSSIPGLRIVRLSHNKLVGGIPMSISALAANLLYLEMGHNSLTGQIPDFLGKFQALDTLDLSWNRFSGTVPKTFANLTKIFNLDLSHNMLVDPFPEMRVKGIESLDLSYNSFHLQSIPQWVTASSIIYSLKLAKCGIKMKLNDWKPAETYFWWDSMPLATS